MFQNTEEMVAAGNQLLMSTVRFQCKGKLSTLLNWRRDPHGAVEQGELERLGNGENPVNALDIAYLDICGQRMKVLQPTSFSNMETGLISMADLPQLHDIVCEVRQIYRLIETSACSYFGSAIYNNLEVQPDTLKCELAKCLSYLKVTGYSLSKSKVSSSEFLSSMIADLLFYQDRLSEFPGTHLSRPADSDIIHIWLEVRWALIMLTSYLKRDPDRSLIQTNTKIGDTNLSWLEQILLSTMFDLAEITARRVDSGSSGGFGCICVEELWFCIVRICQMKSLDFWSLFSNTFTSNGTDLEPDSEKLQYTSLKNKEVYWSLTGSLVNLMHLADIGIVQPESLLRSVKQELKPFLAKDQNGVIPKQVLEMIVDLFTSAGPSVELLGDLWNYFSTIERLNASFKARSGTVEGSAFLPVSAVSWFTKVSSFETEKVKDLDSFQIFIRLAVSAARFWINNKPKDLERFWGRIMQKLPDKKAGQLTDCGVYRVTSLLAALIHVTKQEQPVNLAINIIKQPLQRPGCPPSLSPLCLMGRMTVALCSLGSSLSLKTIGEAITQQIQNMISQYQLQQSDVALQHRAQDAVKLYLSFIEELVLESSLNQDESSLIFFWIPSYLNICSVNEISSILTTFTNILTRCRVIQMSIVRGPMETLESRREAEKLKELIEKLLDILYPATQKLVTTLTCPIQAVDLGVEFLWILLEGRKRGESFSKYTPVTIIQTFTSLDIRDELRVHFLRRISHSTELNEIHAALKDTTLKLVSHSPRNVLLSAAAIACLTVDKNSKLYPALQDTWSKLVDYHGLKSGQRSGELGLTILTDLINSSHSEVLFDICSACESLTKSKVRPKQLYQMAGWLANHCMHIIYRMNQPRSGYLPLISTLLTPNYSFDSAWIPSSEELQGIRSCLPLFLGSMFNHPSFGTDRTLERTAETVIRLHFPRFKAVNHPALFIFHKNGLTCSRVQKSAVLTLVCNELVKFLNSGKLASTLVPLVFQFFGCCLSNLDEVGYQTIAAVIFPAALDLCLRTEMTLRNESGKFLKDFLPALSKKGGEEAKRALKERMIFFYDKKLPFHIPKGFETLKVMVTIQPDILDPTLHNLQKALDTTARNRGTPGSLATRHDDLKAAIEKEKNKM